MQGTNSKGVTIDARAEKGFEPDKFQIQVNFSGWREEKAECADSYNKDYESVRDVLVKAGVSPDQVKANAFWITTRYSWYYEKVDGLGGERYRQTERYADGYEYRGGFSVEGNMDPHMLARIRGLLQGLDGDFTYSISYALGRSDVCERELLRVAVDEARARAEVLASAAGARLGEVESIYHRFKDACVSRFGDANYCHAALPYGGASSGPEEPSSPDFNPKPITVECEITASWALEKA